MSPDDWQAIILTLKLASMSTFLLMFIGPVIAWWLAIKPNALKAIIEAAVALPLVLPPTVLGFYLLVAFAPGHWFGKLGVSLTGSSLSFHFSGLVIASVLYSLPFVVQPLQASFMAMDKRYLEQATLMRLGIFQRFYYVVIPMNAASFATSALLAFAHTMGEFGVVLMIGGNIPGETRVLSIALFDHVETMNYAAAHQLALGLLAFSMLILMLVYGVMRRQPKAIACN